jgi:hypothetical protein
MWDVEGGRGTANKDVHFVVINRTADDFSLLSSVADPDLPDPHVFGPLGSGSTSQRYGSGSGSFYHHAKIVRKTLVPTIFDFLSLKHDVSKCTFKK